MKSVVALLLGSSALVGAAQLDFGPLLNQPHGVIPEPSARPVLQDPLDACLQRLNAQPTQPGPTPSPAPAPAATPRWARLTTLPSLEDDLSRPSLAEAARRTGAYWNARGGTLSIDGKNYAASKIAQGMSELERLALSGADDAALKTALETHFDFYESLPDNGAGKVTGYFTPTIPLVAQAGPTAPPVLGRPTDLGSRRPYFTARQIWDGALAGRGLELYGVEHPSDLLSLQIEGSGWGDFGGGRRVFLSYDGGNGYPFRSVARSLATCGITPKIFGQPELLAWLKTLPLEREKKAVALNPNFVFFKASPTGAATGALGVPLVGGRSVAVDPRHAPLGLPALLVSKQMVSDAAGQITGDRAFARLVFTHDIGGAIKGGARVDLYFGDSAREEAEANHQMQPGRLILLAPK